MVLSDYSIKHPAVITIILIAVVVFGVIAYQSTNQEAFPGMGLAGASILTPIPVSALNTWKLKLQGQ